MIGKLICNRYKIIKHLGTGGMATVWLAEDTILNRNVAIKTFKIDSSDEDAIKRFNREANAVTKLSHNNIVSIYGVENEENFYYLILEYIDGMTLKDYMLKNENIPLETVINIIKQIADALFHAHKNGIIHRDIKPQNILLTNNLTCKITDFGISRAYGDTTLTQTNQMLGTVYYLSPEQARGNIATAQSDIYSLGILMFELLTGKIPFKGESAVAIALKHLQEDLPNIDKYRSNVPQSVKNIILKCTMKNPNDRYLSAKELSDDLETCLNTSRLNETKYKGFANIDTNNKEKSKNKYEQTYYDEEEFYYDYEDEEYYEEKENKYKNNYLRKSEKKSSFSKILTSLFLIIIVAVSSAFAYNYFFSGEKVSVPEIKDMDIIDAKQKIIKSGLEVGEIIETPSDNVKKDSVISTNPSAGKKVKKGTKINLKVSTGKSTIEMPNYLGMDEKKAREDIEKRNFKNVTFEKEESDDYTEGKVMKQNIDSGKEIIPNETSVTITISTGSKKIVTPNLKGKTLEEVYKIAEELGINIKVSRSEFSDEYEESTIVKQDIEPNSEIKKGNVISLIVSKGKQKIEKVIVPNLINTSLNRTKDWAIANNINLDIIYDNNSSKPEGTVLKQSEEQGTRINKNSTITIVVSK